MEFKIGEKVELSRKGKREIGSLPHSLTISCQGNNKDFYGIEENMCASLHQIYLKKITAKTGKK